jgi:oligosaccharyltransferase complex subunit beta
MFSLRTLLVLAAGLASYVNAKSSTGNSVLVVVEPKHQDNFSIFFEGLKCEFSRVSYPYIVELSNDYL